MLLQTIGLEKTYTQGGVSYQALKGVDLEFEAEKFYAIIGKSGSGKSTLLHLLGSLDRPTGGQVILNGEDIYKLKDSRLAQLRRQGLCDLQVLSLLCLSVCAAWASA